MGKSARKKTRDSCAGKAEETGGPGLGPINYLKHLKEGPWHWVKKGSKRTEKRHTCIDLGGGGVPRDQASHNLGNKRPKRGKRILLAEDQKKFNPRRFGGMREKGGGEGEKYRYSRMFLQARELD